MTVRRRTEYRIAAIIFISGGIYGVARVLYFALSGTPAPPYGYSGDLPSLFISLAVLVIGYTYLVFSRKKTIDWPRGPSIHAPARIGVTGEIAFCPQCGANVNGGALRCERCGQTIPRTSG